MSFIGLGEHTVKRILKGLYPNSHISSQVPIGALIRFEDFEILDVEIQNHKFDLVLIDGPLFLVIEVNYKHKEKASKKWRQILSKVLIDNDKTPITIEDYNCEYLFLEPRKRKNPWGGYLDVIRELHRQNVDPIG